MRCRMSGQFAGKTVAITGAAGGIGQWLCRFFGAEGAVIAALDRSDKVNGLVETLARDGIAVKAAVADIASAEAVKSAFAGFGDVHLLINNAGVSRHPTLASTDPAGWAEDVAANLNGAYACAHACCRDDRAPTGSTSMSLSQRPVGAATQPTARRPG